MTVQQQYEEMCENAHKYKKIINIFAHIKNDVVEKSKVLVDDDGVMHKVIDPLEVVEIINERLDEVDG